MEEEEDQLSEMEDESHVESESISNEDQLPKKEAPVIRPRRLFESGSSGKAMDSDGEYSFVNMLI